MTNPEYARLASSYLFTLDFLLRACPDAEYQRDAWAVARATANVLTDERVANCDLRARLSEDGERFQVTFGDLTPEEFELLRHTYQRWLASVDRWQGERTVEKLEATLRKRIAAGRKAAAGDKAGSQKAPGRGRKKDRGH